MRIYLNRNRIEMMWDREVDFENNLLYRILDNGSENCVSFVRKGTNDFRYLMDDKEGTPSNRIIPFSNVLEEEYNKWLVEKILLGKDHDENT